MDPNTLRDHLTRLHEELRTAPRVDPASGRLLGALMEDIRQLMARSDAGQGGGADAMPPMQRQRPASQEPPASQPQGEESLPDRLEKLAVLFEAEHPTLAASSRRLVDLLGKIGV